MTLQREVADPGRGTVRTAKDTFSTMRLERFQARAVHGYLDFDVRFKRDLTFLTGINGSGKTTALNAILALVTPDIVTLSSLQYDWLSITINQSGQQLSIRAESAGDDLILIVSGADEPLVIRRYTIESDVSVARRAEHEAEYFRDLLATHASHPVMRVLSRLPTPMFLGLDRRARFENEVRRQPFNIRGYRPRSVFGMSLAQSLADAAELATTSARDALISSGRISDSLRRDLLLNLLTVSALDFGNLRLPNKSERQELDQVRRDLDTFHVIFDLPREEVHQRIIPFLDLLQGAADDIPADTRLPEVLQARHPPQDKVLEAIFRWSSNLSQLERIRVISQVVKSFNERRASLMEPILRYQKLVNAFLNDSGKSIGFDEDGYVHVTIEVVDSPKDISSLSSGEAQIFVILTHLSFNRSAKEANIFIIDEPELSLHVFWQELFVDSMLSANPNIQYVLATHSPSIILDKTNKCIDLSQRSRGARHGNILSQGR